VRAGLDEGMTRQRQNRTGAGPRLPPPWRRRESTPHRSANRASRPTARYSGQPPWLSWNLLSRTRGGFFKCVVAIGLHVAAHAIRMLSLVTLSEDPLGCAGWVAVLDEAAVCSRVEVGGRVDQRQHQPAAHTCSRIPARVRPPLRAAPPAPRRGRVGAPNGSGMLRRATPMRGSAGRVHHRTRTRSSAADRGDVADPVPFLYLSSQGCGGRAIISGRLCDGDTARRSKPWPPAWSRGTGRSSRPTPRNAGGPRGRTAPSGWPVRGPPTSRPRIRCCPWLFRWGHVVFMRLAHSDSSLAGCSHPCAIWVSNVSASDPV